MDDTRDVLEKDLERLHSEVSAFMKVVTELRAIVLLRCRCGNTAHDAGFYPCTREGELIRWQMSGRWSTRYGSCNQCGRILNCVTCEEVEQ